MSERSVKSVTFDMDKGAYQTNDASPWYATTSLGTPGQSLKLALDTGTNIIWSTSSLCAADECQHTGGGRFHYENSTSFEWVDRTPTQFSFGPWGTMTVETGNGRKTLTPVEMRVYNKPSGPKIISKSSTGVGLPETIEPLRF